MCCIHSTDLTIDELEDEIQETPASLPVENVQKLDKNNNSTPPKRVRKRTQNYGRKEHEVNDDHLMEQENKKSRLEDVNDKNSSMQTRSSVHEHVLTSTSQQPSQNI